MEESGFEEDPLQKLKGTRSAKLEALTKKKRNEITQLMGNHGNLELVQEKMNKDFLRLRAELQELNEEVKGMLKKISETEVEQDQAKWYEPRAASLDEFEMQIEKWTKTVQQQPKSQAGEEDEIRPKDSASNVSKYSSKSSSASSSRLKLQAEKAALLVKAEALKKRQSLEKEEAELKAKKEQLEMQTEIQATSAKLNVFTEFENTQWTDKKSTDGMNEYFNEIGGLQEASGGAMQMEMMPTSTNVTNTSPVTKLSVHILEDQLRTPPDPITQSERHSSLLIESGRTTYHPITPRPSNPMEGSVVRRKEPQIQRSATGHRCSGAISQDESGAVRMESYGGADDEGGIVDIMRCQNTITEVLVKQQRLSSLPPLSIPLFKGDPLDYKFFIRAFEHGIDDKTENCKDRLYFLEQFTMGQPRELVRSCQHMEPSRGYKEAKRLLHCNPKQLY